MDDPLAVERRGAGGRGGAGGDPRRRIRAGRPSGSTWSSELGGSARPRRPRCGGRINATGVVVHTNLGRAPLAARPLDEVVEIARRVLEPRVRPRVRRAGLARRTTSRGILRRLTGAEAALVVNNNAAAVLLALAALAEGREVLVSRGELIEIGDGFRIPDVLARVGREPARGRHDEPHARRRLRPCRSGPRPRCSCACTSRTSACSASPSSRRVEELAARRASGTACRSWTTSVPGAFFPLEDEPSARDSLTAGADLVCFSGDKLLGGPQAGIVVGRADLVERLRRHPLQRALRADKLTLAALEGDAPPLPRPRAGAARDPGAAHARRGCSRGACALGQSGSPRSWAARSRRRSAAPAAARFRSPSCRASPARSKSTLAGPLRHGEPAGRRRRPRRPPAAGLPHADRRRGRRGRRRRRSLRVRWR